MRTRSLLILLVLGVLFYACHPIEKPKNMGNNEKKQPVAVDSISVEESEISIMVNDFFTKITSKRYIQAKGMFLGSDAEFKDFYKKKFGKKAKDEWRWQISDCEIHDMETARVRLDITISDNNGEKPDEVGHADLYVRHKDEDGLVYDLVFF